MKKFFNLIAVLYFFILSSCGISDVKYSDSLRKIDSLNNVISSLKEEIDELKNGDERISSLVERFYKDKNYKEARSNILKLKEYHPESKNIDKFDKILALIEKELLKEKQDSIRLANLGNLGIWNVRYFVDEFKQPTDIGYITSRLYGVFSNSATNNSELRVEFIICSKNDISIKLYEYNRSNPVKDEGEYTIYVLDKNKNKFKLNAYNYYDRIRLSDSGKKSDSEKLYDILMRGGEVRFNIEFDKYSTREYNFVIENADFFENAVEKLKLSKKK